MREREQAIGMIQGLSYLEGLANSQIRTYEQELSEQTQTKNEE